MGQHLHPPRPRRRALAGLNKGSVDLPIELTPGNTYGLFVEITDGNAQGEANICVFQPHRFLTA
ncbi:hypothetical protein ACFQZ4_04440 [Catellatospora coxensis]